MSYFRRKPKKPTAGARVYTPSTPSPARSTSAPWDFTPSIATPEPAQAQSDTFVSGGGGDYGGAGASGSWGDSSSSSDSGSSSSGSD